MWLLVLLPSFAAAAAAATAAVPLLLQLLLLPSVVFFFLLCCEILQSMYMRKNVPDTQLVSVRKRSYVAVCCLMCLLLLL